MKKIIQLGYLLTLVLFLMLPKAVLAAACVANSYDQYAESLNPGFSCTVGDLEFSAFSSMSNGGGPNFGITPQNSAGQTGFAFSLGMNSSCNGGPEGCVGIGKQLDIFFTVTALNGLITGNSISMTNYSASGSNSTVGMSSLSCSNCSSPPSLTASNTFSGVTSMQGSSYLHAIAIDSGNGFMSGGYATLNDVTMLFTTESTVVPIPAAMWLFGSGLLGLLGFAHRKKI